MNGKFSRRKVYALFACLLVVTVASAEDLYRILGVGKKATAKEIKKAYRRKALDTHPDKNKGTDPEKAAEAFRKVVHAFEILSDEGTRKYYDRTGRTDGGSSGGRQQGGGGGNWQYQWHWNWNTRPIRLKDRFDVQQAQSRVLHVVSLEQLRTIMLDDNDLLERNILMCFVKPGKVQQVAEDEIVFPYPFAGMSSQRIWWEDLLQTVQIRFHRSNELSRFFGVPDAADMNEPVFLFGKRGQPLSDSFSRLSTLDRGTFERWVWKQIEVNIEFVNEHPHPVEVYWIHHSNAKLKLTLEPNHRHMLTSMLSHEWWVRDARVDTRPDSPGRYKLTDGTCLATWKIVNDTDPQQFVIQAKECYDLSGHCSFWRAQGECRKNPSFMADQCRKTCKLCTDNNPDANNHDEF